MTEINDIQNKLRALGLRLESIYPIDNEKLIGWYRCRIETYPGYEKRLNELIRSDLPDIKVEGYGLTCTQYTWGSVTILEFIARLKHQN